MFTGKGSAIVKDDQEKVMKQTEAGRRRYFISLAKKNSRPGIFETLGSYDLNADDAELFGDDRYRRLINILIYRSRT